MYTEFERMFLTEYFDYLRSKDKTLPNEEKMMFPNDDIIKDMKKKFFELLNDTSTMRTEQRLSANIDYEGDIETKIGDDIEEKNKNSVMRFYVNTYFISVLRDVLTYLLALKETNKANAKDKLVFSYITNNHIRTVIANLEKGKDFADTTIKYYIQYLIAKHNFILTSDYEDDIFDKYEIITTLDINKGYTTINDLIRRILEDMYGDYYSFNQANIQEEENDISDELLVTIDEFFFSDKQDTYLLDNGIDDANKEFIRKLKEYTARIVLADAFLDFTIMKFDCESTDGNLDDYFIQEEKEAYEFIEAVIESGEYLLPVDAEVRHDIYKHFYFYNRELDLDRKDDLKKMIDGDESEKLLKLNPLCFLE